MRKRSLRRWGPEPLEPKLALSGFYVSTLGSDTAAGTESAPWRTLQHAASRVKAGDSVTVRAGNYAGFDLRTDGTASNPIVFRAEPGVVIDSPNPRTSDGINLEGADHIVIEGFQVVGQPRAGIRSVVNQHVVIRDNWTDQNTVWGIFSGFSESITIENNQASNSAQQHGIYVSNSADNPVIRGNTIWGNRAAGIHMNGDIGSGGDGIISGALVENNVIYENGLGGGSGINCDGVQGSRFQNNLLYDNHASGISLYRIDGGGGSTNNVVINNTVVNAAVSRWAMNIQNGSTGNQLFNNVFYNYHISRGSINISSDSLPGLVSDYNVVMNRFTTNGGSTIQTLAQWRSSTGQDQHSLIAAPNVLFVNAAADDYHLSPTSPAINAGTAMLAPPRDFEGDPRPSGSGWDIGADEYIDIQDLPAGGPYSVVAGRSVVLDRAYATPPGEYTYSWDLDNDGQFGESGLYAARGNETGLTPTFSAAGATAGESLPVTFRVTYGAGPMDFVEHATQVDVIAPSPVLILDQTVDGEPAVHFEGEWFFFGGEGVGRLGNGQVASGESFLPDADTVAFTFNLPGPGRYSIATTWYTNPEFRDSWSTGIPYQVSDGTTVLGTPLINQRLTPSEHAGSFNSEGADWAPVGTFEVTGSTLTVKISGAFDNKYVIADAVRVEKVANVSPAAEINVTMDGQNQVNIPDGSTGAATFGETDFYESVTKTFTISNLGSANLVLTGPVTVNGPVFTMLSQPLDTDLAPGESTTFQVQMSGTLEGNHSATVSFGNDGDDNEDPFNFTVSGTVLSTNFVDDKEPRFFMSPLPAELGGWGQVGGTGRPGRDTINGADWVFNINRPGFEELATWTFDVTPGVYRVSTTWAFQNPGYDDAAPFTIFDGTVASGTVVGGRHIDQKNGLPDDTDYPAGFGFPFYYDSSGNVNTWERIDVVHITGNTLTVLLAPEDANDYVLADSILIDRLGDRPAAASEIVVTTNNRTADKVDYGTTELQRSIDKTFTIRNTGTSDLTIGSPSIIGANPAAFEIVSGPSSTTIAPNTTAEFVVRLTAAYPGVKNATLTLTTNDPDEPTVNLDLTGNVNQWHIIDDHDPVVYSDMNMSQEIHGSAYRGDHSFAASSNDVGPASATWTFTNVSPGIYYVALTWFGGSDFFADNAQLIVRDGAASEADVRFSQRNAPAHFQLDNANWQYVVFGVDVSSPTVTVTLTNDMSNGFILADAAMLVRIADTTTPPPGNSESLAGQASGQPGKDNGRPEAYPTALYAPSSGGTLRSEPSQASAGADTLSGDGANNVLLGGGGLDELRGQGGYDLLVGGTAANMLIGGQGEDLLFGGGTSYYSESSRSLNLVALKAVLQEWTSGADYAQRLANLTSGAGALIRPTTMTNDNHAVDRLFGEDDQDWFITRTADVVEDEEVGETITAF